LSIIGLLIVSECVVVFSCSCKFVAVFSLLSLHFTETYLPI
jgi:hypothetical protein